MMRFEHERERILSQFGSTKTRSEVEIQAYTQQLESLVQVTSVTDFLREAKDSLSNIDKCVESLREQSPEIREKLERLYDKKSGIDELEDKINGTKDAAENLKKPNGGKCPNCNASLDSSNKIIINSREYQKCSNCGWIEGGLWTRLKQALQEIKKAIKALAQAVLKYLDHLVEIIYWRVKLKVHIFSSLPFSPDFDFDLILTFLNKCREAWKEVYDSIDQLIKEW